MDSSAKLSGRSLIEAVKKAGVDHVLSVPDLHTSKGLLRPIADGEGLKLIRVCKEDECIGIACGLSYGDIRALTLIQYTGFLYAMNAIRGIACEQGKPICMMIGLLGHNGGPPRQSPRFGVRVIEPMLEALGVDYHVIDSDEDVPRVTEGIEKAYETSRPVAFLIARRPEAP